VIRLYQNAVAGEIARFDGHLVKFMGNGVLAYFGWPTAHEDEAERAIRVGIAIRVLSLDCKRAATGTRRPSWYCNRPCLVGVLIGEGAAQEEAVVDTPTFANRLQHVQAKLQLVSKLTGLPRTPFRSEILAIMS
jgi:class 3 adenylate cyclase